MSQTGIKIPPQHLNHIILGTHTKNFGKGKVKVNLQKGLKYQVPKTNWKLLSKTQDAEQICTTREGFSSSSYADTQVFDPKPSQVWPGAIYDPIDLAKGNLKEKVYPRKPIKITTSCVTSGKPASKDVNNPSHGEVQTQISQMVNVDSSNCSSITWGTAQQVYSQEDFFMKTSGSGHFLGFGGSHDANYESSSETFTYMLDVTQNVYSISADDKNGPADFFYTTADQDSGAYKGSKPALEQKALNPNWTYVKTVDYGRRLLVMFESKEDLSKFGLNIKAWAEFGVAGGKGETDVRTQSVAKQVSMKVLAIGGDSTASAQFVELGAGNWDTLSSRIKKFFSGKVQVWPLAYHLSTLSGDDVGINFTGEFQTQECSPLASRYEVKWTRLYCSKNDDGGDNEQVRASVSIIAYDGQGKEIMDEEKKNLPGQIMEKALNGIKKGLRPPTFTLGTEQKPLYLKENPSGLSKLEDSNTIPDKSVIFKLPNGDPNKVRLKLGVGITEFDKISDDHFTPSSVEVKLAELPINTPITRKLKATHEASVIVFEFTIRPIYN